MKISINSWYMRGADFIERYWTPFTEHLGKLRWDARRPDLCSFMRRLFVLYFVKLPLGLLVLWPMVVLAAAIVAFVAISTALGPLYWFIEPGQIMQAEYLVIFSLFGSIVWLVVGAKLAIDKFLIWRSVHRESQPDIRYVAPEPNILWQWIKDKHGKFCTRIQYR